MVPHIHGHHQPRHGRNILLMSVHSLSHPLSPPPEAQLTLSTSGRQLRSSRVSSVLDGALLGGPRAMASSTT